MRCLGVLHVLPILSPGMGYYSTTRNHPLLLEACLSGCSYNVPVAVYIPGGGVGEDGESSTMRVWCFVFRRVHTTQWLAGVQSQTAWPEHQYIHVCQPSAQLNIPTRWIILLSQWEQLLTESDSLGLWGLGVAIWIQRQTSKSSPAILWLSTRIRDSLALKNRTALFHALESLCLFEKRKTFCES